MNLHKNSQSNYNVHPTLDILYFFAHYAQSVYFYIFKFPIKVTNSNLTRSSTFCIFYVSSRTMCILLYILLP